MPHGTYIHGISGVQLYCMYGSGSTMLRLVMPEPTLYVYCDCSASVAVDRLRICFSLSAWLADSDQGQFWQIHVLGVFIIRTFIAWPKFLHHSSLTAPYIILHFTVWRAGTFCVKKARLPEERCSILHNLKTPAILPH